MMTMADDTPSSQPTLTHNSNVNVTSHVPQRQMGDDGPNSGDIAGGVVGGLLDVAAIAGAIIFLVLWRKRRLNESPVAVTSGYANYQLPVHTAAATSNTESGRKQVFNNQNNQTAETEYASPDSDNCIYSVAGDIAAKQPKSANPYKGGFSTLKEYLLASAVKPLRRDVTGDVSKFDASQDREGEYELETEAAVDTGVYDEYGLPVERTDEPTYITLIPEPDDAQHHDKNESEYSLNSPEPANQEATGTDHYGYTHLPEPGASPEPSNTDRYAHISGQNSVDNYVYSHATNSHEQTTQMDDGYSYGNYER